MESLRILTNCQRSPMEVGKCHFAVCVFLYTVSADFLGAMIGPLMHTDYLAMMELKSVECYILRCESGWTQWCDVHLGVL